MVSYMGQCHFYIWKHIPRLTQRLKGITIKNIKKEVYGVWYQIKKLA